MFREPSNLQELPNPDDSGEMTVARTDTLLRAQSHAWREHGLRISFVPTMGALHEGHLALVRRAREVADRVVVSIFVNPAQFNDQRDLEAYPRNPNRDATLLAALGCHLLFLPQVETLYPADHSTWVEVEGGPAEGLEGENRPGHFRGVATVVAKLFNLVQPDIAVFGEKDAQQLAVVRRMVRDLHFPVEILGHPTIREEDGLACSSRNARLDTQDRRAAGVLYRALEQAERLIARGERSAGAVRQTVRKTLEGERRARIEYVEVVDADTFRPVETLQGSIVVPIAVRIGDVRLIDNLRMVLDLPEGAS
ncbi:MAG: pantoate--beta-alanine ligase [Thermoanaerobaculia bacterium]